MPSNWLNINRLMPLIVHPFHPLTTNEASFAASLTSSLSTTLSSSNIVLYSVVVTEPYRVLRFWWQNGSTLNGNVEVAVFTENGTRIATTGSTAQSGANVMQQVSADFTLGAGRYWIGMASNSSTATFAGRTGGGLTALGARDGSGLAMHVTVGTAIPMPSSIVIGSNLGFTIPSYGIARLSTF